MRISNNELYDILSEFLDNLWWLIEYWSEEQNED